MHSCRIHVWAAAAALAIIAAASPALAADGWTRAQGTLNVGRAVPTMVELKDGRILVTGGEDWDMKPLASTEIYDPAAGTWTSGPPLPAARRNVAAIALADGRVLVAGGELAVPNASIPGGYSLQTTASTQVYDPKTNKWTAGPAMAVARHSQALVTLADGRVLVVGGIGSGAAQQSVAQAETLDALATRWTAAGTTAVGQTFGAVVRLADGRVLLAGGATANGSMAYATARAHVFDPATGKWTEVARMSAARGYPAYGLLPGGVAMVVGGAEVNDTLLSSAERFDPATNSWSPAPSLDAPRYAPGTLTTASGRLMLVGGIFAGEFDYTMYDDGFTYRVNQVPAAVATLVSAGAAVPNGEAVVRVSAAGSSDADGDPLTFTWSNGATVLATTTAEAAALGLGIGTHALTLTVSDADGARATASLTVTVLDATAPFAQQIADLTATNAALTSDNAALTAKVGQLTTQNTQLTAQHAQLTAQNTQLTTQNAQLTTQNGLLSSENAMLTKHVAELTEQLERAQQNNLSRAAIDALNTGVELAMRVRFRNPSFRLPGTTPEQKLAAAVIASLATGQSCQQQMYQALGGSKR